jgi:hypothetical protein
MRTLRVIGIGALAAVVPRLCHAQQPPPQAYAGLSFQVGQARGQFADYVDVGWGGGGYVVYRPGGAALGVRLGATYLIYGSQTHRYPLVPGVTVDVTTRNQIAQFAIGPQLTIGQGVVRVYGFGAIGASFFWTNSSVEGSDNNQPFASTTNYHDGTFAGELGSGLQIRLGGRRVPIFADLGVRYVNNGRVTYVTKDRVTISGNQLLVDPVDSEANLLVYHLGVTVGLPPGPR